MLRLHRPLDAESDAGSVTPNSASTFVNHDGYYAPHKAPGSPYARTA